jgi:hypothetical protein
METNIEKGQELFLQEMKNILGVKDGTPAPEESTPSVQAVQSTPKKPTFTIKISSTMIVWGIILTMNLIFGITPITASLTIFLLLTNYIVKTLG